MQWCDSLSLWGCKSVSFCLVPFPFYFNEILQQAVRALSALTLNSFQCSINNNAPFFSSSLLLLPRLSITLPPFFLFAGKHSHMGEAHWTVRPPFDPSPVSFNTDTFTVRQHDVHQPAVWFGRAGTEVWPGDWEEIWDSAVGGLLHVLPLWNHLLLLRWVRCGQISGGQVWGKITKFQSLIWQRAIVHITEAKCVQNTTSHHRWGGVNATGQDLFWICASAANLLDYWSNMEPESPELPAVDHVSDIRSCTQSFSCYQAHESMPKWSVNTRRVWFLGVTGTQGGCHLFEPNCLVHKPPVFSTVVLLDSIHSKCIFCWQ